MELGEVYRHAAFYVDPQTGESKPKFFLVLAAPRGGDVLVGLLTSRAGRPEEPRCHHGAPYPAFFLGVLGGPLARKTWLDLREIIDLDPEPAPALLKNNTLTLALSLGRQAIIPALECAAGADDTTRRQESQLRDVLASLRT